MWGGPIEAVGILILSIGGALLVFGLVSIVIYLVYEAVSYITMMLDWLARSPLLDWFMIGVLAAILGCAYFAPPLWRLCIGWLTNQSLPASLPVKRLPPPGKLPGYRSHLQTHILPPPLTIDCRSCGNEMAMDAPCRICGWQP